MRFNELGAGAVRCWILLCCSFHCASAVHGWKRLFGRIKRANAMPCRQTVHDLDNDGVSCGSILRVGWNNADPMHVWKRLFGRIERPDPMSCGFPLSKSDAGYSMCRGFHVPCTFDGSDRVQRSQHVLRCRLQCQHTLSSWVLLHDIVRHRGLSSRICVL